MPVTEFQEVSPTNPIHFHPLHPDSETNPVDSHTPSSQLPTPNSQLITNNQTTSQPLDLTKKNQIQKVYALLQQIPAGRVTSYAALARALQTSPRAIGGALRRNPFAPEVVRDSPTNLPLPTPQIHNSQSSLPTQPNQTHELPLIPFLSPRKSPATAASPPTVSWGDFSGSGRKSRLVG